MFLKSLLFSFFLNENFFSLFFCHFMVISNRTCFEPYFILGDLLYWKHSQVIRKTRSLNTVLPAFVPKNSPPPSLGKGEALEFSVAVLEVDFSVQALLNEQSIISQGLLSSVSFLLFHYSPHLPSEFKFLAILTV